ncbi:MAG: hypothetical protein CVU48_07250 [Candidatus Cloacimonetes bacterium HGW-Cloacimonetes-1]|jgi:histone acetyltransferase (RNA polymerase elongator complex component)|nr:MAG: hypothetical protein CVU48_07250 [Candidatus Cloacimonetes bacterium HGW-Cloacimonetes-1]
MLIYPVFLPNWGCTNQCVYCDQTAISATGSFDQEQLLADLKSFVLRNRNRDKQIAFFGGSFTGIDEQWRTELFDAISEFIDPQTGFRISTSPDLISPVQLDWCKAHRVQTIELGVQDFFAEVLQASGRSYDSLLAISACDLIRDYGFELGIQLMPGLPGWTLQSLQFNHLCLLRTSPQYLRLYPTIVIRATALAKMYQAASYEPLSMDMAIAQCADYVTLAEPNNITVIKMGLPSTIEQGDVVAGPYHPAFGEFVRSELYIRDLEAKYRAGIPIVVDSHKHSLLLGHGKKYLKILEKRLDSCNIDILFAGKA